MKLYELNTPTAQRGAVLIVSLLILMIMTIIGVSTLSTTTLQEQMAANTANKYKTYQGAESAIGLTIIEDDVFKNALDTSPDSDPVRVLDTNDPELGLNEHELGLNVQANTEIYMDLDEGEVPHYIEEYSIDLFVAIPFVITGSSTFGQSGARSKHIQGVNVVAPGP